jgi:hypothetical protein
MGVRLHTFPAPGTILPSPKGAIKLGRIALRMYPKRLRSSTPFGGSPPPPGEGTIIYVRGPVIKCPQAPPPLLGGTIYVKVGKECFLGIVTFNKACLVDHFVLTLILTNEVFLS